MNKTSSRELIAELVLENAARMFREPEGIFTHPYLDPAGQYGKMLWDWDSYWTSLALLETGRNLASEDNGRFLAAVKPYAAGSLRNLLDAQKRDGSIPISMAVDDPDIFDSGRCDNNMAKPIQGQYLALLLKHNAVAPETGRELLRRIIAATNCRLARYQHASTGLLVWANETAIGVDDDPCVWGRPAFSTAQTLLNFLWIQDLAEAAAAAEQLGDSDAANFFTRIHAQSLEAVRRFLWDERDGFFYSADVGITHHTTRHRRFGQLHANLTPFWKILPIRIYTWGGFMALWCRAATEEQAARVVEKMFDSTIFKSSHGLRSVGRNETRYYRPLEGRGNPSNWLGPIWIVANYIAIKGLEQYGYKREAETLRGEILTLLADDYAEHGYVHEYYDPESGRGVHGPNFLSWNLLASCL